MNNTLKYLRLGLKYTAYPKRSQGPRAIAVSQTPDYLKKVNKYWLQGVKICECCLEVQVWLSDQEGHREEAATVLVLLCQQLWIN